jgi:putative transcriptional regulator
VKKEAFDELVASVREAGRVLRGEAKPSREFKFSANDVRAIRDKLHKSQSEFAIMIGVSVSTLRNWEQGRREPVGPARALLKIAAENPRAVEKALGRHSSGG